MIVYAKRARPPRRAAPSLVARMAEAMIDAAACSGSCTDADLLAAGFAPADIRTLGAEAARQATAQAQP
ncbi:MAG TPA: hypothetical protein DCX34_03495 [Roseovarius sp.]|nr:hypothetical protein [Roseovarius sp.]